MVISIGLVVVSTLTAIVSCMNLWVTSVCLMFLLISIPTPAKKPPVVC